VVSSVKWETYFYGLNVFVDQDSYIEDLIPNGTLFGVWAFGRYFELDKGSHWQAKKMALPTELN
jgi:hypothetical protein